MKFHLGKRSAGWKFLWNPNVYRVNDSWDFTYPLTKQGITDFLNQEGMVITDDYGKTYEPDEFLAMAFNWCVDGLDAKEYYTNPKYGEAGMLLSRQSENNGEVEESGIQARILQLLF